MINKSKRMVGMLSLGDVSHSASVGPWLYCPDLPTTGRLSGQSKSRVLSGAACGIMLGCVQQRQANFSHWAAGIAMLSGDAPKRS